MCSLNCGKPSMYWRNMALMKGRICWWHFTNFRVIGRISRKAKWAEYNNFVSGLKMCINKTKIMINYKSPRKDHSNRGWRPGRSTGIHVLMGCVIKLKKDCEKGNKLTWQLSRKHLIKIDT